MKLKKSKRKVTSGKSRAKPEIEIYVKTTEPDRIFRHDSMIGTRYDGPGSYARAHNRTRGEYRYLVWRDGATIRELYLGRKRS